jgi:membrane associated rhomboid family serine protease
VVIPIHDVNPVQRTAVVTYTLIVINIVVFLISPVAFAWIDGTSVAEACGQDAFFRHWGAIPRELLTNAPLGPHETLVPTQAGYLRCPIVQIPGKVPLLSALTSMFLHGGWAHLAGNMLYLYVFGNNVEDRLGRVRFLLFYLAWGLLATYGYALINTNSNDTLVGASGAIAGVLGAYLVMFPRARVWSLVPFLFFIPVRLPAWIVLGLWFVLQWFYSLGAGLSTGAGVAYAAHVVGFVFGLIFGAMVGPPRQPPRRIVPYRAPPYGGAP